MTFSSPATLGIDFGTSNSAVAWLDPEGRAQLIALEGTEGRLVHVLTEHHGHWIWV